MKRLQLITIILLATTITVFAQKMNSIRINNVSVINSATLDFSPTFYKNGIVFVSCNAVDGKNKAFDAKINKKAMSIFLSQRDENGELKKPEPFSLDFVSTLHEGPLSFDKKNEIVFFCRNDSKKGNERGTERVNYVNGFSHMKIYSSERTTGSWTQAQELSVNEEKTDACHPTISYDGTRLYFASNRPGGYGGMDLYMSEKVYGKWSKPINLGPKINTLKNEVFPFIHESGALFYSSDDSGGKTGLDIYHTKLDMNGVYEAPQSMGAPFNSDSDDFGFILDSDYKTGYMTSNRAGGKGEDDIYAFTATDGLSFLPKKEKELEPVANTIESGINFLNIFAVDRKTGRPLSNITITATPTGSNEGNNVKTVSTNAQGKAILPLSMVNDYALKANSSDYKADELSVLKGEKKGEIILLLDNLSDTKESKSTNIATEKTTPPQYKEPQLSKTDDKRDLETKSNKEAKATPINKVASAKENPNTSKEAVIDYTKTTPTGSAVDSKEKEVVDADVYHLSNIYYDFNDFRINAQSALVLDTLAGILKKNPEMVIELSSHTDCRGASSFNEMLSKRRAESVLKYLRVKDVNLKQLKSISLGETSPKNECIDYVPCPPEKHQSNRRTEVKILKRARPITTSKE